jgi:outer membrane protein assembly factor BamA
MAHVIVGLPFGHARPHRPRTIERLNPSRRMYDPLPVELSVFADGGVAWNSGEKPSIFGGTRDAVSSTGVTLRVNLMGFAVGQFDFVRPLQRPGRGWIFQFNLSRGF